MSSLDATLETIIQIVERGEIPKASDFKLWAELKDWQPIQTAEGPLNTLMKMA